MASLIVDSMQFTVPANTDSTGVKMRLREMYNGVNMDPCSAAAFGECEDYTIYIYMRMQVVEIMVAEMVMVVVISP